MTDKRYMDEKEVDLSKHLTMPPYSHDCTPNISRIRLTYFQYKVADPKISVFHFRGVISDSMDGYSIS